MVLVISFLGWVRGNTKAYIGQKSISFDGHTHSYAAISHNHSASQITSGALPVTRGGTGVTSLDELKSALQISEGIPIAPFSMSAYNNNGRYSGNTITIDSGQKILITSVYGQLFGSNENTTVTQIFHGKILPVASDSSQLFEEDGDTAEYVATLSYGDFTNNSYSNIKVQTVNYGTITLSGTTLTARPSTGSSSYGSRSGYLFINGLIIG